MVVKAKKRPKKTIRKHVPKSAARSQSKKSVAAASKNRKSKKAVTLHRTKKREQRVSKKVASGERHAVETHKPVRQSAKIRVKGEKHAGRPLLNGTYYPKQLEGSSWRLVNASGIPLGRLSSIVASVLMGKDKPTYTRFADVGDHVIVINAKDVVLTGNKWKDKLYQHHTNYPGGLKTATAEEVWAKYPERLVEYAVYRMLPQGHMGERWKKKLRVFAGAEHHHHAQKPVTLDLPSDLQRQG